MILNGVHHKFEFQGQESQEELDLNWISFKWRNHDPAIGRFMSIDPLAVDYTYNSTYAFSENKVIMYNELEGLETGPAHWMQSSPSAKQAGVSSTAWQKLYTVNNETESNIAIATIGTSVLGAAFSTSGVSAVVRTFLNEVKDEVLSYLTGGASDVIDISKNVKNIVEVGAEKLAKKVDIPEGGIPRIQNAADRINKNINVVGSRADGTATATSDYDYVIEGVSSKEIDKIKNSLPGAKSSVDNLTNRIDLFKGKLNETKPHITVKPNTKSN